MYDSSNEAHEFVADARDEAIEKACKFFGVSADQLEIRGFEAGDVYGLGGRAVIVAGLKGRTRPEPRDDDRGEGRRDRSDRGGNGRGRGDGRRERGGRRGGRGEGRRERGDRGERGESRARASEPEIEAPSEPSVGTAQGSIGEVGEFIKGLVERLDVGPFQISESEDGGDLLVVEVRGAAAAAISSRAGRAGDAIQLLANQAAVRIAPEGPRVVVDIEGDADAREELLGGLARRIAKRALDTGRSVALDPMNGRDRRSIHIAVRDIDDVASMSIGEGRYRQVVVVPKGAPEFEEANEESRRASSDD